MSSNSILGTSLSERRWEQEMENRFVKGHGVQIHCVFQVPTNFRVTKPQAYAPQRMGLGPYHHLRPELYATTHKQKLAAVMELGGSHKPDIVKKVVDALSKSVPTIRDCYREYLDLFPKTLTWILTVDGLFLFHYLKGVLEFAAGLGNERDFPEMEKMAGDIILLENQIPRELLKEIGLSYRRCLVNDDVKVHRAYVDYILNGGFLAFCQMHSPLKLSSEWKHIRKIENQAHLLHLMYHLIVNNRGVTEFLCSNLDAFSCSGPESSTLRNISRPCKAEDVEGSVGVNSMLELCFHAVGGQSTADFERVKDKSLAHLLLHMNRVFNPVADDEDDEDDENDEVSNEIVTLVISSNPTAGIVLESYVKNDLSTIAGGLNAAFNLPAASIAVNCLSVLDQIPWDRISSMFQKADPVEEHPLADEEIALPTVRDMTQIAGIKFIPTPGGIRDAKFDGKESTFFLPVITMNTHSETILRNLLVYEAALAESAGSRLELAEYVGLMCSIIDTNKDVKILMEANIVQGELGDQEIAAIFNGMRETTRATGTGAHKEMLSQVAEAIAEAKKQRDNAWRVKIKRNLVEYGASCGKYIRMSITVVVVLVLLAQAFCTVFSCPRWSANSRKLQLHSPY